MFDTYLNRFRCTPYIKDLICTQEWSKEKLNIVIELAAQMKKSRFYSEWSHLLPDRSFLMLFYNSSTRTHLSFEAAVTELGGHAIYMNSAMGWFPNAERKGESIEDAAQVISGYMAGMGIRAGFHELAYYGAGNEMVREYAKWASIPIINMADDKFHPCQGLADVMSWLEWFGENSPENIDIDAIKGKTILFTWAQGSQGGEKGSARPWNSIQESLLIASRFGMNIILARPDGYDLDPQVYQLVQKNCEDNQSTFDIINDPSAGYRSVDIVYSRNWASSEAYQKGCFQKKLEMEKAAQHKGWITTTEKMLLTNNAIFTHPMPVDRGSEVVDEVASGPNSVIYNVARNRLHIQKAALGLLIAESGLIK